MQEIFYAVPEFELDEKRDITPEMPAWLLDGTHSIPPWTPLYDFEWHHDLRRGFVWAGEALPLPYCRGTDFREYHGSTFACPVLVEDEEEIKQREAKFRESARPFIEDWGKALAPYIAELRGHYDRLKQFDVDAATEFQLAEHWRDYWAVDRRAMEIHFYTCYLSFSIVLLFEELCTELLALDDTSLLYMRLFQGLEDKLLINDDKLRAISVRAVDLGVDRVITAGEIKDIMPTLSESEAGRKWASELNALMYDIGWQCPRMCEYNTPSWVEDPSLALEIIKGKILSGLEDVRGKRTAEAIEDRNKAEEEVLAQVPAARREAFRQFMRSAQPANTYCSDHDVMIDMELWSLGRRAAIACGKRLQKHGLIGDAEDVLYLVPPEVEMALFNRDRINIDHIVDKRKEMHQSYLAEAPAKIMFGNLSLEEGVGLFVKARDAILTKFLIGRLPKVRPELKADLYGIATSPGVAEGTARVIMDVSELGKVQKGDILVAPTTYAAWTPVFGLINATVIDRGGSLAHGSVMSREYRIPCVVNVMEGTTKISTGQRIRVDGNEGVVYILES